MNLTSYGAMENKKKDMENLRTSEHVWRRAEEIGESRNMGLDWIWGNGVCCFNETLISFLRASSTALAFDFMVVLFLSLLSCLSYDVYFVFIFCFLVCLARHDISTILPHGHFRMLDHGLQGHRLMVVTRHTDTVENCSDTYLTARLSLLPLK